MTNNRTLINYIKEFIHTDTIKDNIKLLIYVSQNNDYDSFDVDDWVEISNEPLTENDIERMKLGFWLLEHQENIQELLAVSE